jgi:hypothetical protein
VANLGQTFDPHAVPEDERSFDPVPSGDYLLQAIDSDVVPTKGGTGTRLILTLEIMEGAHTGRKIWDGINIYNQSEEAQRIGQRQLADLCLSIGLNSLSDSAELIGRPFRAKLKIQQDKTGQYPPRNAVARWHIRPTKMEQAQAAAPAAAASAQPPAAAPKPAAPAAARPAANQYAAAKGAPASPRPWATR